MEHPGFEEVTDASYVCTLTPLSEKVAKEQLNEVPKERLNAVVAFRGWINQQPHFTLQADTVMLLSLLRTAKFSQLRARDMAEGYVRTVFTHPEWFRNIDSHDPRLSAVLDTGMFVPLPKADKDGRSVWIVRPGKVNLKSTSYGFDDEMRAQMMLGFYRNRDENQLVHGVTFIIDLTGITMKHITRSGNDEMHKWNAAVQRNFPGRYKGIYVYNAGPLFEAGMALARPFLSKKMKERLRVFDTAESLYKVVDMELLPLDYLPDDYTGQHAGNCDEIVAKLKAAVRQDDYRRYLMRITGDHLSLDISKKPPDIPQASFRKLNVD